MQYIKVAFLTSEPPLREMLMAWLTDGGYDGFEETETELLAYIDESNFDQDFINGISGQTNISYKKEVIPSQNWNALWESNFEPVIVDDFCTIRAHFHDIVVNTPYDIVITPKMSFGTGHHATTCLMMVLMKDLDLKGKKVLDFGTGTGILAILAEKLGATEILAIDHDEWPVENAIENSGRNNCNNIRVQKASLEDVPEAKADVILANINRHILLNFMNDLWGRIENDGKLLISGILNTDVADMQQAAKTAGFEIGKTLEKGGWAAILLQKNH